MLTGECVQRLVKDLSSRDVNVKGQARDGLYRLMSASHRLKSLVKRLSYNAACMDKDDVNAEFWKGVIVGMDHVKSDIGDPVAHLVQRGVWQVKSIIRSELAKKVTQQCQSCRSFNIKYNYKRICASCGGNVENVYRSQPMEDEDVADYVKDVASMSVDDLKTSVNPKFGRLIESIYEGCTKCAHNESPLSYAAKSLGVSKQRVSFLMRQMRKQLSHS